MMIAEVSQHTFRRVIIPLGVGLIALATLARGSAHAEPKTFILDPHDGYGIAECFVDGVACGRVVANSWCEANGRGPALAFGLASDMTASIALKDTVEKKPAPGSVLITCGD